MAVPALAYPVMAGITLLLTLIELGISIGLVRKYRVNPQPRLTFMLFASSWALFSLLVGFLLNKLFARALSQLIAMLLNILAALFWLAGSATLIVTFANCRAKGVCNTIRACAVFGFFCMVMSFALAVVHGLLWRSGGSSTASSLPSRRRGVV